MLVPGYEDWKQFEWEVWGSSCLYLHEWDGVFEAIAQEVGHKTFHMLWDFFNKSSVLTAIERYGPVAVCEALGIPMTAYQCDLVR